MNFHGMHFRRFWSAYMECAAWTEEEQLNGGDGFADETVLQMELDCRKFYAENLKMIDEDPSQAGHDFWLTRNGHGAGFWDGDWPEVDGAVLTLAAKKFGAYHLYVGDDGKIYGSK